jgi:acyl carrier protein
LDQSVFDTIARVISSIHLERGEAVPELKPQTPISASGLDSLDIAALVVRLEEAIGVDPFKEALDRYPQTLGEMADLYARSRR